MFNGDELDYMNKQKYESKRHPQFHFSDVTAFHMFLEMDTCIKPQGDHVKHSGFGFSISRIYTKMQKIQQLYALCYQSHYGNKRILCGHEDIQE